MTTGGNPAQGFLLFLFLQIVSQKALQLKPLLPKATRASSPYLGHRIRLVVYLQSSLQYLTHTRTHIKQYFYKFATITNQIIH